jgi:hypothetical protein
MLEEKEAVNRIRIFRQSGSNDASYLGVRERRIPAVFFLNPGRSLKIKGEF